MVWVGGGIVAVATGVDFGVATTEGVAEAATDRVALGEASGRTDRPGSGVAMCSGVAVARAAAGEGAAVAEVTALAGAGAASTGFTNVRDGALGGGVASVLIFTRTFSAAWRSPTRSQPWSTTTWMTGSLMPRGRSTG